MSARRRHRLRRQRRRRYGLAWRISALSLFSITLGATAAAFTATNTVAASRAANKAHTISVPELTPANCVGAAVGNVTFYRISGPGGLNRYETGHQADTAQIWLGTAARDNMAGGNGNDCMLPGGNPTGGNETVGGGAGTDYCYSGPGPGGYTFNSCANGTRPTGPYTTVTSVAGGF